MNKKDKLTLFFLLCLMVGAAQNLKWAKGMPGMVNGYTNDINLITDPSGNVYTTGAFSDTSDMDPGTGVSNLITSGVYDMYLQKLDSSGNYVWSVQTTSTERCGSYGIAIDDSGNVFVTGEFYDSTDFDPGIGVHWEVSPNTNRPAIFILKISNTGNFVWVKKISGPSCDIFSRAISLDDSMNIFITGSFSSSSVDFNPGAGVNPMSSSGLQDIFVLKLDANGNFIWARKAGGTGHDESSSIHINKNGDVLIGGSFQQTVDFDPGTGVSNLSSTSVGDFFLWKLNSAGNFVWVKGISGLSGVTCTSIVTDSSENIYCSGNYSWTVDFDPGPGVYNLGSGSITKMFVLKVDSGGNFVWARSVGGTINANAEKMVMDKYGKIYVTGVFCDMVDFDPGSGIFNLNSSTPVKTSSFIQKLDSSGNFIWAIVNSLCTAGNSSGKGLYIDDKMNIYSTGNYETTSDMDPGSGNYSLAPLPNGVFVSKLSQDLCSAVTLVLDSVSGINCSQPNGYASSFCLGASSPYTFQWNTTPVTNDSIATFSTGGIYNLVLSDANNCTLQRNVLIGSPSFLSDFDLNANLIADHFQFGTSTDIWLDGFNDGCDSVSGTLSLVLPAAVNLISSNPAPDFISGDTLNWNFSNLVYQSTHISPHVQVTPDSTVQMNDTLCLELFITPLSGDANISNNNKTYCLPVLSGYDPNFKSVYPQGVCEENYTLNNQKLTYTVHFQNTGTASAIHVNILDSLSPGLDINTVNVIAHSHTVITEILPGSVLKLRFDNIMLPDSGTNEPLSHGYIIYEVSPLSGSPDGTEIKNKADIYFDLNAPVTTNTTINTLVAVIPLCDITTGSSSAPESSVQIYPNPAKDYIIIENSEPGSVLRFYDNSGRLVWSQKTISTQEIIDMGKISNGFYALEISDHTKKSFHRIIINH